MVPFESRTDNQCHLGMGVAYDGSGSALVTESEHGIWKAGRRCPDIVLSTPGYPEKSRRLYSTLAYGFSIVSCVGALKEDWSRFDGKTSMYRLVPVASSTGTEEKMSQTFECSEIHPDERFVVVVRPDTYIGYVGTESSAAAYLSQTLGW